MQVKQIEFFRSLANYEKRDFDSHLPYLYPKPAQPDAKVLRRAGLSMRQNAPGKEGCCAKETQAQQPQKLANKGKEEKKGTNVGRLGVEDDSKGVRRPE